MLSNLILPLVAVLLFGTGTAFAEPPAQEDRFQERPMDEFDTDRDGAISAEESRTRAAKKFDEIDTDKDGVVTLEEMDKYHAAEKARHEERRAKRDEEMKKKRQEKMDPDGDGKITREEFLKSAAERHSRMDSDGDGKVTKEDMKKKFGEHRKGPHGKMKPAEGEAPAEPPAE